MSKDFSPKPGYSFPGTPPKEAIDFFRSKDLRVGFDYRDVWGKEHAAAFTVAKAMQIDILEDIREAVDRALADGTPFLTFRKELEPILQKKGWWGVKETIDPATGEKRKVQLGSPRRLRTIFESNLRSAHAAGQWERAQRTKSLRPYLLYQLGPSKEHRLEHTQWNGLVLRVDDPFWRTHMPPNGWGCKCHVRQLSAREAERRGISTAPATPERDWVNRRTGEVEKVPEGIDPGWSRNPGQDRQSILRERLTQKVDTVDQQMARAAVTQVVNSPILEAWKKDPKGQKGELPVAVIDRNMQQKLAVKTQVVRLSDETVDKQNQRHPELTVEQYRLVPNVIYKGTAIKLKKNGRDNLVFFHQHETKWYKAVVKKTEDDKLYLSTFHRSSMADIKREKRKGSVLRGLPKE